jgi:hypothetical protein
MYTPYVDVGLPALWSGTSVIATSIGLYLPLGQQSGRATPAMPSLLSLYEIDFQGTGSGGGVVYALDVWSSIRAGDAKPRPEYEIYDGFPRLVPGQEIPE